MHSRYFSNYRLRTNAGYTFEDLLVASFGNKNDQNTTQAFVWRYANVALFIGEHKIVEL